MEDDIKKERRIKIIALTTLLTVITLISTSNIYHYFNPRPPNKHEVMVGECIQLNCDTLQITNWSLTFDYFIFDNGIEIRGNNVFNNKGVTVLK